MLIKCRRVKNENENYICSHKTVTKNKAYEKLTKKTRRKNSTVFEMHKVPTGRTTKSRVVRCEIWAGESFNELSIYIVSSLR